jgi:hypothetical protein
VQWRLNNTIFLYIPLSALLLSLSCTFNIYLFFSRPSLILFTSLVPLHLLHFPFEGWINKIFNFAQMTTYGYQFPMPLTVPYQALVSQFHTFKALFLHLHLLCPLCRLVVAHSVWDTPAFVSEGQTLPFIQPTLVMETKALLQT